MHVHSSSKYQPCQRGQNNLFNGHKILSEMSYVAGIQQQEIISGEAAQNFFCGATAQIFSAVLDHRLPTPVIMVSADITRIDRIIAMGPPLKNYPGYHDSSYDQA
jgi:hypothetical protein